MSKSGLEDKNHFINFRLGNENFAISVFKVIEIINNRPLTKVPNSSTFIKGVINFRGEIVPIIDMHRRFNMNEKNDPEGMIIIVDIDSNNNSLHMGLLVDEVEDIIKFEYKDIRKSPEMGINYDINFVDGVVDIKSQFIMVLNVDKVLNKAEIAEGITIAEADLKNNV
ncbi:MAG: purine-binding chemotaxis protein CheW [Bacteroidales bacterium]|nr:purine-binding chemotaxis protein CheW [Bacteroidales bacterium]